MREVKYLKLANHLNIVHLKETFRRKEKLHLVFEFAEKTILDLLEKSPHGISKKEKIKYYLYQLLKAVNYLHDQDIIHRDVKPENLLVTSDDVLKLCDFGFARKIPSNNSPLTDYVATRWYRSPELLLTDKYGKPCDIWAIGCIMGELADGKPLFPGKDQFDQLYLITKVIGNLPNDVKELFFLKKEFRSMKLKNIKSPETLKIRYLRYFKGVELDFISGLLEPSPSKRLTAREAYNHSYFDDIRIKENDCLTTEIGSMTHRTGEKSPLESKKISPPQSNILKAKRTPNNSIRESLDLSRRNNIVKPEPQLSTALRKPQTIRIKKVSRGPGEKRKTFSQNLKYTPKGFESTFTNLNNPQKSSFYNIYENQSSLTSSKIWEQKRYPFPHPSVVKNVKTQASKQMEPYRTASNSMNVIKRNYNHKEMKNRMYAQKQFEYTTIYSKKREFPNISRNTYYGKKETFGDSKQGRFNGFSTVNVGAI